MIELAFVVGAIGGFVTGVLACIAVIIGLMMSRG